VSRVTGHGRSLSGSCGMCLKQEDQLSQRDRATLHVIEYSAKLLKFTQDHSK